jgi:hypothetical protein
VADEDVAKSGIPEGARVLFLCREEDPLEPQVLEAIQAFQKKGGKVFATSDCLVQIEGAVTVPIKIKNMWEMSGFAGKIHGEMWEEFEKNVRQPLADALAKTDLAPLAVADWERGLAVALTTDHVRYVVVIADKKGAASGVFEPVAGLPVSLAGTGWTVRDLVKQTTLKTEEKDGRTTVAVDLITEPATILALYKARRAAHLLRHHGQVRCVAWTCSRAPDRHRFGGERAGMRLPCGRGACAPPDCRL